MSTELTAAEQRYMDSGGTDVDGLLAENSRQSEPARDDGTQVSSAFDHWSRTGEVSDDLRREMGDLPPSIETEFENLRPAVRDLFRRAVGEHVELKQDYERGQLDHARLDERLNLLIEAVSPAEPEPEPASEEEKIERQRQQAYGIRDPGTDVIGAMNDVREIWHEMQTVNGYRATLDDAIRQAPAVHDAYMHVMVSRTMELMGRQFPNASPQQIHQAVMSGQIPNDVRRAVEAEERATFVGSKDPVSEITRTARSRGWHSPAEIEQMRAIQAEQDRRAAAKAEADRGALEDIAHDHRARFAQQKHFWDEDTTFRYNTSGRTKEHRDWFYNHKPGPAPYLPSDFK
jgi:hypothetical protein